MTKRTVSVIAVVTIIVDLILLTIALYFYQFERWATGSIYMAMGFSGTFFTIIGVSERVVPEHFNEELKIMESDKKYLGGNSNERGSEHSTVISC